MIGTIFEIAGAIVHVVRSDGNPVRKRPSNLRLAVRGCVDTVPNTVDSPICGRDSSAVAFSVFDGNVTIIASSLRADWLMIEDVFPVCSPALRDGPVPLAAPEDLSLIRCCTSIPGARSGSCG